MNTEAYTERLFECNAAGGQVCRGIITDPLDLPVRKTLVCFPAGIKYRTGPGGLHVHLARTLARFGVSTVRLDVPPLGECEGTLENARVQEIWNTIEQGRFIEDGCESLLALSKLTGRGKFHLTGLCGGAATAQMIAACDPELVEGLIQFNPAVTLSQVPGRQTQAIGGAEAKANLSSYLTRLASPQSWARALGGISDYRSMMSTLQMIMKSSGSNEGMQLSPFYKQALETTLQKGIRHLFIMSGNDQRWFQFQDLVLKLPLEGNFEVHVIPGANHELHWPEWRVSAEQKIAEWLGVETS